MDKKEQAKLRSQRYRDKQNSVTNSVTQTGNSVTKGVSVTQENVTQYPAIIRAIIDPVKREKLEKIHQSLKEHKVLREVRYGTSGPTFELIGDMLEATG